MLGAEGSQRPVQNAARPGFPITIPLGVLQYIPAQSVGIDLGVRPFGDVFEKGAPLVGIEGKPFQQGARNLLSLVIGNCVSALEAV